MSIKQPRKVGPTNMFYDGWDEVRMGSKGPPPQQTPNKKSKPSNRSTSLQQFSCTLCSHVFGTRVQLLEHQCVLQLQVMTPLSNKGPQPRPNLFKKPFECPNCKKGFLLEGSLRIHICRDKEAPKVERNYFPHDGTPVSFVLSIP
jgi:hypothetical protein